MSVEVTVKQRGLFKKRVNLRGILMSGMGYGVMNEAFRLEHNQTGKYTVVFFHDLIHRGFEVNIEKGAVNLKLPLPTSGEEICRFYDYVKFLCKKLGVRDFLLEGVKTGLDSTEDCIRDAVSTSMSALTEMRRRCDTENSVHYIFGAYNPIALDSETLDSINCDIAKLGEYLHRLQSTDAFYTMPLVFNKKSDGTLFALYSIVADLPSVVPYKPSLLMNNKLEVKEWYAAVSSRSNDNTVLIDFNDFVNAVDKSRKYDAEHFIATVSEEEKKRLADVCGTHTVQ